MKASGLMINGHISSHVKLESVQLLHKSPIHRKVGQKYISNRSQFKDLLKNQPSWLYSCRYGGGGGGGRTLPSENVHKIYTYKIRILK